LTDQKKPCLGPIKGDEKKECPGAAPDFWLYVVEKKPWWGTWSEDNSRKIGPSGTRKKVFLGTKGEPKIRFLGPEGEILGTWARIRSRPENGRIGGVTNSKSGGKGKARTGDAMGCLTKNNWD